MKKNVLKWLCVCISMCLSVSFFSFFVYADNDAVVLRSDLLQLMNMQRSEIDKQFIREDHSYYEGPAVIWWYQNFGAYFGDCDDDYIWDEYDEAVCENIQPRVLFAAAHDLIDISSDTVSAELWEQTFGEGSVLGAGTNEMEGDYLDCAAGEYVFHFTELDENHCIREDSHAEIRFRTSASVELIDVSDYEYYAIVKCLRDGRTLWEYQSKIFPKTELIAASDVYIRGNAVYAALMGELFCFNKNNGEIQWSVPDVGAGNAIAFDKTGNLYISGYYGPNLLVIDCLGTVLYKDESEDYGWVSALKVIDSTLQIYYYFGEECTERYGAKKEIDISVFQKPEIQVLVNDVPVVFDQPPIIKNDRTLVPLRAIFEALGAEVTWDETTRTVYSQKDDTTAALTIDSDKLVVNGTARPLDVPAVIINNRTLVPVRAVSEAFSCNVSWNGETRTVAISTS